MIGDSSGILERWKEVFGENPQKLLNPRYARTRVRIRDVNFSELCETLHRYGSAEYWEKIRGKWAEIETGTTEAPRVDQCGGPYFNLTQKSTEHLGLNRIPGTKYKLCLHMFEGD